MIKRLFKKYLDRWKQDEFEAGFSWAMVEYHLHGATIEFIESYLGFEYSAFDSGVNRALHIIHKGLKDEH